jgi:hypothetical protein
VGELVVFGDGAVFILPSCGSQIHAYANSMYPYDGQGV